MTILFIEEDKELGIHLVDFVKKNNLNMLHVTDIEAALSLMKCYDFELAILDLKIPERMGYETAKKLRALNENMSFLFLSSYYTKEDVISGLHLGAVEYMTKPFGPDELILRIYLAISRKHKGKRVDLYFGRSSLKQDEYKLSTPASEYKLTPKESDLLAFIIKNKNHLIKRDILLSTIWGENDYFMGRSMDVFISRLRKLLRDDNSVQIETLRKVGYVLKEIQN